MAVSNMDGSQETVYRTNEESHVVMSEKVQSLAGSVYQEFEKMMAKYDHDVVKDLMPLVVNVLECLDTAYTENQEHEVELELVREDNEQLVTQYEREKQLRKTAEQKLMEVEDLVEDERKELGGKIESLESLVRMLELKAKNSTDHVFRLEEKENEMKKEYQVLHERYTELFKTHVDYMERTKMMLSTSERLDSVPNASRPRMPSLGLGHLNRSSGPVSFGFQSLEEVRPDDPSLLSDDMGGSPHDSTASNTSLRNELNEGDELPGEKKGPWSDQSSKIHSPQTEELPPVVSRSTTQKEQRSGNTLYQELSFQDPETGDAEDSGDVTGSWVHPGEYASSGWKSLRVGIKSREIKPANDNFFGMGKEVENLIMENNELLATKNALNIVKDDLILKVDELTSEQEVLREELTALHAIKDRLKQKISELEEELKKVKEEAAKTLKGGKSDDEEEDVPMAQRKRFTRLEMARVLMERNQYKERLLELQEAVRWSEAIRATRIDVNLEAAKSRGLWRLFGNLFGTKTEKEIPLRKVPSVGVHFSPNHVTPALPPSGPSAPGERKRPVDFLDRGPVERKNARRALERREQYRQVRAHVRKEDGRLQAYGWSLPARGLAPTPVTDPGRVHVPVPVPVYCQPLATTERGSKVWCAAGVNLSGGRTRDGGSIVGGSVFYGDSATTSNKIDDSTRDVDTEPHITRLEEELKEGEKIREESETLEQRLSSIVWICSSMHNESRVTIVDATDPQNALDSFIACPSHLLCISSVPGATEVDYGEVMVGAEAQNHPEVEEKNEDATGRVRFVKVDPEHVINQDNIKFNALHSTILPTMWLGAQTGHLYVHSSVTEMSKCIASVRMPDSVLCITYCAGRVLVALANGAVAVFRRGADAQWNLSQYDLVELGDAQASVRCMSLVYSTVWCGYKNKIHVLDPINLVLRKTLEAHPRKESQVRQLAWLGDGVWVSIRLDSTLRLYHAHTYQHLQDVDIEPYVSKMLGTGKLGFSFVRTTALLVSTGRLWIGTGEGVVISVPLSEEAGSQGAVTGGAVRVYTDAVTNKLTPGSFIPYCSMSEAQLSFHGHREAVKFFIAVPGAKSAISNPHMLVMSGGEGYVDFRTGDGVDDDSGTIPEEPESDGVAVEYDTRGRKVDMSHLIIWQVALPAPT